jgi:hypothetical protein
LEVPTRPNSNESPTRIMGAIFIADHAASVEPPILVVSQLFEGIRVPTRCGRAPQGGRHISPLGHVGGDLGKPEARAHGRSQEAGGSGPNCAIDVPGPRL